MVKVSTEIDHEQIFTSGMIHRSCGEAARPMDHGTGTSTTSMYLSNMVPTQTPAKTIQTSVLRRTGTGARFSGSINIKYLTVTGFSDNPFFSLRDTVFSENPVTAGAAVTVFSEN